MNREQLEAYVDAGEYCDQDIIDLWEDHQAEKAKNPPSPQGSK